MGLSSLFLNADEFISNLHSQPKQVATVSAFSLITNLFSSVHSNTWKRHSMHKNTQLTIFTLLDPSIDFLFVTDTVWIRA